MRLRLLHLAYRVAAPLGHAWWAFWGSRHDGVKCVISNNGDVLLVRHTYGDRRRWDYPGGFVGRGEEPVAAARREMAEELGLVVAPGGLRPLGSIDHNRARRRGTVHYFGLDLDHRMLAPDPVELSEAAWFRPGALPRRLGDYVGRALGWTRTPNALASVATNPGSPERG